MRHDSLKSGMKKVVVERTSRLTCSSRVALLQYNYETHKLISPCYACWSPPLFHRKMLLEVSPRQSRRNNDKSKTKNTALKWPEQSMSWTVSKLSDSPEAPPLHLPAELLEVKMLLVFSLFYGCDVLSPILDERCWDAIPTRALSTRNWKSLIAEVSLQVSHLD